MVVKHWPSLGGFDSVFDCLTLKDPSLLNEISGRAAMLRTSKAQEFQSMASLFLRI